MFSPSALLTRVLQLFLGLHGLDEPVVPLGDATVTGFASTDLTQSFLGIPFAAAPRFDLPVPIETYSGNIITQEYGPACIQHNVTTTATPAALRYMQQFNISVSVPASQSEDCVYPTIFEL